ncbi:MAG TPA: response regulator transcription factor, partial [Caldilineaceae bacterium]|nr:response regulator transcription factor [Caldilineaceae bacterium]
GHSRKSCGIVEYFCLQPPYQKLTNRVTHAPRDKSMCQTTEKKMVSSDNSVNRVRLLIADGQPRVRQSLEALLTALYWGSSGHADPPIVIVGEADDGLQVVEQVQALHPDVVVLDLPTHSSGHNLFVSGSKLDGLVAIRTIKHRWPTVRIVVLTMYATDRAAVLLAGADAFLLKGCPTSELLDAVLTTER